MSGLDNANPIIFKPSQQSVRKSEKERFSLWDDETIVLDHAGLQPPEEDPEEDPIDEQEIFGE